MGCACSCAEFNKFELVPSQNDNQIIAIMLPCKVCDNENDHTIDSFSIQMGHSLKMILQKTRLFPPIFSREPCREIPCVNQTYQTRVKQYVLENSRYVSFLVDIQSFSGAVDTLKNPQWTIYDVIILDQGGGTTYCEIIQNSLIQNGVRCFREVIEEPSEIRELGCRTVSLSFNRALDMRTAQSICRKLKEVLIEL